jgi:hypothetical protein
MTKSKAKGKKPKGEAEPAPRKSKSATPSEVEAEGAKALRGTAPWLLRHAKKHADEARARNTKPAPPESARATLRVPDEAERIKRDVGELFNLTREIKAREKKVAQTFFEIGERLAQIREARLFAAKGYASFEAFVERELGLGKALALDLERIYATFRPDAASHHELAALRRAIAALADDDEPASSPARHLPSRPPGGRR